MFIQYVEGVNHHDCNHFVQTLNDDSSLTLLRSSFCVLVQLQMKEKRAPYYFKIGHP